MTKSDMTKGYWQVLVDEESQKNFSEGYIGLPVYVEIYAVWS